MWSEMLSSFLFKYTIECQILCEIMFLSEIFGHVNDFSVFYMDSKDTVGGKNYKHK